jgi:hypothetical protein
LFVYCSTPKNRSVGNGRQIGIGSVDKDAHAPKLNEPVQSASEFNYEFIQNPAKKAFFESTRSSPGSATISPRSVNSPRLKQQVTFKDKNDEILPSLKSDRCVS